MQLPTPSSTRVLDRRLKGRHHGSDRRYNKRVKVDMLINRFVNGQPYLCRMVDISRTGIRLAPMIEPDGGQSPSYMGLQFQLSDRNDVLTASGMAITRDDKTVGVRFTRTYEHLTAKLPQCLAAFLRRGCAHGNEYWPVAGRPHELRRNGDLC